MAKWQSGEVAECWRRLSAEPEDVSPERAFHNRPWTDYVLNPLPPEPQWDE